MILFEFHVRLELFVEEAGDGGDGALEDYGSNWVFCCSYNHWVSSQTEPPHYYITRLHCLAQPS